MSLNNISLPSQLLADLYHHSLVEGPATAMPQTPPLSHLGRNEKKILIVVNKPNAPFLPDGELAFLTKVLTACQLGLLDVAIVNWAKAPHPDAEAVLKQFDAKSVILFDVEAAAFRLPANLPVYTVFPAGSASYVVAPSLHLIEQTKEAKGQLWVALKQLFEL
jgi:hypothetical protein